MVLKIKIVPLFVNLRLSARNAGKKKNPRREERRKLAEGAREGKEENLTDLTMLDWEEIDNLGGVGRNRTDS